MINATLVTVHGFWSSPTTWERLSKIWAADEQLRGLTIHPFGYLSPKKPSAPFSPTRIPDYDDIAQTLATEYTVALADADNVAIVTHSQGGLIAQRFLAWMLSEGRGRELARIRSIVMLACPNGGSEYLRSIRQVLGYGRHPQAGNLEVLNRQIADTQRTVLRQIVNANGVDDHQCRIPLHVYAGSSDKVVTAASAQAGFPGAATLAGNHFSILDPAAPGNQTAGTVKYHLITDLSASPVQPIRQASPASASSADQVPARRRDTGPSPALKETRSVGHAFISYVREDSREVDRMQEVLKAAGIRVWRDTADLWPGEDWRVKIRSAITHDAFAFIACFSENGIAREVSYQNEELALAIEQLRLRRPDAPWLIPVRFDNCHVPDLDIGGGRTLSSIQRVDLFGDGFGPSAGRLAQAVARIFDRHFSAQPGPPRNEKLTAAGSPAPSPAMAPRPEALPKAEGAVTLMVRHDAMSNAYRFQFIDADNPPEVTAGPWSNLTERVKSLHAEISNLARGRTGFTGPETRHYLRNLGAQLWVDFIPDEIRRQFWERQDRIRHLTITSDVHAIPWELLYPIDSAHDAGFLVEQFPLTRKIFDSRLAVRLHLEPRYFVAPSESPAGIRQEIESLEQIFDEAQPASVISALTPLLEVIRQGDVGLLHLACHNRYDRTDGSVSIMIDRKPFVPNLLTTAAITHSLARAAPLVFVNSVTSIGWARPFLNAGAGAFIGSLWEVTDDAARAFAEEFYRQFLSGESLGTAVMRARQAISSEEDDPSWLAYAVYGDPDATIG